ncbi:MAG: hypothetical protein QM791_03570 [Ferruginibacter sp.]
MAIAAVNALFLTDAAGVYNITDGSIYSRYDFADIIKSVLNKKAVRFHIPLGVVKPALFVVETINRLQKKPSVVSREKLHELIAINWGCDISRLKKDLKFAPRFDLKTGLAETIGWYKEQKWL